MAMYPLSLPETGRAGGHRRDRKRPSSLERISGGPSSGNNGLARARRSILKSLPALLKEATEPLLLLARYMNSCTCIGPSLTKWLKIPDFIALPY